MVINAQAQAWGQVTYSLELLTDPLTFQTNMFSTHTHMLTESAFSNTLMPLCSQVHRY